MRVSKSFLMQLMFGNSGLAFIYLVLDVLSRPRASSCLRSARTDRLLNGFHDADDAHDVDVG